jgi:hypothetical protein
VHTGGHVKSEQQHTHHQQPPFEIAHPTHDVTLFCGVSPSETGD